MTTHFTDTTERFVSEATEFAAREIQPLHLGEDHTFPHDLWQRMGEAGLLGLTLPETWGGAGQGYLTLSACGEALVRHGGNMGIVVSWL
ncbi:MAG: acyl-CoA dehydrogenase family protein, partial [Syntrophales bacterium]|nr:acyl-CoA dehydrogenase family protein [Syntrophales bacterium]